MGLWFRRMLPGLLICLPGILYAQKQGIPRADSLKRILFTGSVKEDTNKVKLLGTLVNSLYGNGSDEMISYARQELRLAEQLHYQKGIATGYYDLGQAYVETKDLTEALKYYSKALECYKNIKDNKGVANCSNRIGWVYFLQSDHVSALQNYLVAEKIFEETDDNHGIADCHNNIGLVYKAQKNYAEAMKNYTIAMKVYEKENNKKEIAGCSNSIGDIYEADGKYPEAISSYMRALTTLRSIGDNKGLMWPYYNIGEVLTYEGRCTDALKYLDSALSINIIYDDPVDAAWCYNAMALAYLKDKKYAEAESYAHKCLEIGNREKDASAMLKANQTLSMVYKATGKYDKALTHYEAYIAIRDSTNSTDNRLKIAALETRREAELKERQIKINELSITEKRNERIIFAAGSLLLAIIITAIYRNYKTQKRTNKTQQQLLLQKEMLMKEIHHRVKNNLQVISTLLDLQLIGTSDAHAKAAITESTVRVKAISLIHQQLYQYEDISSIEFSGFTTDLYTQVSAALGSCDIKLVNKIPHTILDVDTAVSLGLMINELLTNSYKYAFNEGAGSINIKLEREGELYVLQYKDSGPGLAAGQDVQKPKSLGMTLLKNLSKQVGGSFRYDWSSKTFIITFKDMAGMKMTE